MGLFDNLIKKAKETVEKFVKKDNVSNNNKVKENINIEPINPFADDIVKKYYEIIFAMNKTIDKEFLKAEKLKLIAKGYIEKQLNESSDERKIEEALSLFKLSKNSTNKSSEAIFLREFNKELKDKTNYIDTSFDAISLCYEDEINLIKKEYDEILETIKNEPKPSYLGQGIEAKIYDKYHKTLGIKTTGIITSQIIYNSLVSGNIVAQSAMIGLVKTLIDVAINKVKGNDSVLPSFLAALSVRALHFEKTPNVATIENSEYRELLLSHSYYKNKFGPFIPEDKISDEISYSINGYGGGEDLPLSLLGRIRYQIEGYDCIEGILRLDNKIYNLICNLVWKDAIEDERTNDEGVNITNSQEVSDIFTILNQYFAEIYGCIILA